MTQVEKDLVKEILDYHAKAGGDVARAQERFRRAERLITLLVEMDLLTFE